MIIQQYTTVFIDRDGTIGGNGHFQSLEDFKLFPYTLEAIDKLKRNNIKVFGLSNQTHIEDGKMNYYDFFNSLISVGFDDAFICPHSEKTNCDCRKPKKGLINQAHAKYDFENSQSVIIGDRYSADIKLALECDMLGIHTSLQENKKQRTGSKAIKLLTLTHLKMQLILLSNSQHFNSKSKKHIAIWLAMCLIICFFLFS